MLNDRRNISFRSVYLRSFPPAVKNMRSAEKFNSFRSAKKALRKFSSSRPAKAVFDNFLVAGLTFVIFYLSLMNSSLPVDPAKQEVIDRAIAVLEKKGFSRDAALLRKTSFRAPDNWLNHFSEKENAYAATNFPFRIITLYRDFYTKTADDTERAMILMHESRHLRGADESEAYEYVWRNRQQLGWTQLSHGMKGTYTTIELQTRQYVPQLFRCPEKLWDDCTSGRRVGNIAKSK